MLKQLLVVCAAVLCFPNLSSAHSLGARLGDFYEGFLHPPLTFEHLFPLLALAAWLPGTAFGMSHGYSNGQEVGVETDDLLFFSGVAAGALLVIAYGSAVVLHCGPSGRKLGGGHGNLARCRRVAYQVWS